MGKKKTKHKGRRPRLEERIRLLREGLIARHGAKGVVPDSLQGVTKKRIRKILEAIDRNTPDNVDAVFALLDEQPSWFSKAVGKRFCDGATTAHIGCHVGLLQRAESGKLDREGRDYWIKPLRDIGAVEAVYLHPSTGEFLPGHQIARSGNSAYRLADSFVRLLREKEWEKPLKAWASANAVRERLALQANLAKEAAKLVDAKHSDLIAAAVQTYCPAFLPGFEVVYVDDGDGVRISPHDAENLRRAGVSLLPDDPMPDALLWNPESDWLWVIEAVTSDGEADVQKVTGLRRLAERHGKAGIGFTTAYRAWKVLAARQAANKNLVPDTYVWVMEDGAKQLRVEATDARVRAAPPSHPPS